MGPVDLEEVLEESENRADLFRALLHMPCGIEPDQRDRHLTAARVEDFRVIIPARRRPDLKRLVQINDDRLEADVLVEIQLGGAECLAFQAECGHAWSKSSVATEAPLEKSRMEWAEAKRILRREGCRRAKCPASVRD